MGHDHHHEGHDHEEHDHGGHQHSHGADDSAPIACDLTVFKPDQKRRYGVLAKKMHGALVEKKELPNGWALRLSEKKITFGEAGDWMSLESKCCRFMEIALEPGLDGLWLKLTGRPGVKEFLKQELRL
ncbi:MAG TPA: hypothetical protein VEJ86_07175 [Candidatus Binataceae bacterium]|nr:hypothetical protein [Candidatus Binataceae bacterium]